MTYLTHIRPRFDPRGFIKPKWLRQTTLFQGVHHRVKNNRQVIMGMIGLQTREHDGDNPELVDTLRNIHNRIYIIALTHDQVYPTKSFEQIDSQTYFEELVDRLVTSMKPRTLDLEVSLQLESVDIDADMLIPCGIVVNELVTNALEHTFEGRDDELLTICFRQHSEDQYELVGSDDGKGWRAEESFKEIESLGIRLVRNLVQNQLNGTTEHVGSDEDTTLQMSNLISR